MPVHRPDRDRLAELLAAHLRGEVSNLWDGPAAETLVTLSKSAEDDFVREIAGALLGLPRMGELPIVPPQTWDDFRRTVAFLKTDLPPASPPPAPFDEGGAELLDVWTARVHLAVLLAVLAAVPWLGWWPLVGCWAGSWLLAAAVPVVRWNWPRPDDRDFRETLKRWRAYFPFEGEQEWRANEPNLQVLNVPAEPPAAFVGRRRGLRDTAAWVVVVALCVVPWLVLLAVVGAALMLAIWPLLLIGNALYGMQSAREDERSSSSEAG